VARATKRKGVPKKSGTALSAKDVRAAIPTAADFRLLGELDEFNKHIKAAVAHLLDRGYHQIFVKWMLRQHESYAGVQVLSKHATLVDYVTMHLDERTGGARRRELIERLVEAGALDGEGGNDKRHKRLRDRLSNARKWKRERDEVVGVGVVFEMDDPISIECSVDEVIDDIRGFNRTRAIAKRLRAIGALGDSGEGLREQSLNEVLRVIGEELLFLETAKVRRIDRARLNEAVRKLDKEGAQGRSQGTGRLSRRNR
jgi:hypothetical protein